MSDSRYRIVFSGEILPGHKPGRARKALSRLLNMDEGLLFSGERLVIRDNLDFESAMEYGRLFEEAGASCGMEDLGSPEREASSSPAVPELSLSPVILRLPRVRPDILLSPVRAPRVSPHEKGLKSGRPDIKPIAFDRIQALCLVCLAGKTEPEQTLLVFAKGAKRPFAMDSEGVRFGDFPGVKTGPVRGHLRNFILFLANREPGPAMDFPTYEFVTRGRLPLEETDTLARATAMARCLEDPKEWEKARSAAEGHMREAAKGQAATVELPTMGAEDDMEEPEADLSGLARAGLCQRFPALVQSLFFLLCFLAPLTIPIRLYFEARYGFSPVTAFRMRLVEWNPAEVLAACMIWIPLIYQEILAPAMTGKTWGQGFCGIIVVGPSGKAARGLGRWVLRFLGSLLQAALFPVSLLAVRFSRSGKTLPDLLSRTEQKDTGLRLPAPWHLLPFSIFFLLLNLSVSFKAICKALSGQYYNLIFLGGTFGWVFIFFLYRYLRKARP